MSADDAVPLVTGIGPGGLLLGQGSPREVVVRARHVPREISFVSTQHRTQKFAQLAD